MSMVDKAAVFDRRIATSEMRARYLCDNDGSSLARATWLREVFQAFQEQATSNGAVVVLPTVPEDFDVLVVGGDDAGRMAEIVTTHKALLARRLKIALVARSQPNARAHLLVAGFDDVMDVGKVHPEEGMARLRAMWRRYNIRTAAEDEALHKRQTMNRAAHLELLNKREACIIEMLVKRGGECVPYKTMMETVSEYHEPISFAHLKTLVSNLRKKLKDGARIQSRQDVGYYLSLA